MAVVIGKHGLIGGALAKILGNVTEYPTEDTDVIYDCAGPTHLAFERSLEYNMGVTISRLLTLLPYCKKHDILYVYFSTALIYEREQPFTHAKMAVEEIIKAYGTKHLIIRLWPVYGNEEAKGDDASVIYKWEEQIKRNEQPEVYADGTQERGFIHVDEVASKVTAAVKKEMTGIYDLAGEILNFNKIIASINKKYGKNIKPKYVSAPQGYSMDTPLPRKPLWTG